MIKLSNINKSFNQTKVLLDMSFSIKKNEFVCITGESGSGKTTLLNIIGLLDKPDSGVISINGKSNFTEKEIVRLRRNFYGYIFQDYLLMADKTVEDNFKISNYGMKKRTEKNIMEKVGLNYSILNKKVYQLSGGEQQRVAIARMMMKPYELVLADEPTGNLDYKNKNEVIEIFKDIKKEGKTIICVSHDKDIANSADRIIKLSKIDNLI